MDKKKFELSKSLEFSIPSYTQNLVTDIQASIGERNKELERIAEENYNNIKTRGQVYCLIHLS